MATPSLHTTKLQASLGHTTCAVPPPPVTLVTQYWATGPTEHARRDQLDLFPSHDFIVFQPLLKQHPQLQGKRQGGTPGEPTLAIIKVVTTRQNHTQPLDTELNVS